MDRFAPVTISPDARRLFPTLTVNALLLKQVDPSRIPLACALPADPLAATPLTEITALAGWREAYRAMKLKPSDYRSSVEALVRRVRAGKDYRTGIPFVDLYNSVSLATYAAIGAYDLDAIGPLEIRPCRATDRFTPLGSLALTPVAGTLCYCDGDDIVCYALNYRDAARSAVHAASRNILVVAEAISAEQVAASKQALALLAKSAGLFSEPLDCSEQIA